MSTTLVIPSQQATEHEAPIIVHKHKSIFENAVCLSVGREWPSLSKTIPKDFVKVDKADKSKFHASMDLFNSVALKKMMNLEIALDNTLKRYASAPFPLKTGVYILGIDLYNQVEAILAAHVTRREELINEFVSNYEQEIAKAKEFQGDAFDPSNYKPIDKIRAEFKFRWDYLTMDVAENLSKVGKAAVERQQEKMEEVWQDARVAVRSILRGQMASLVNHLVDRLSPGEEGKRKIFRNTVLDPVNDFLKNFDPRNLTDDSDLKNLVSQAQQLVNGVSPEDLRSNEALKASVQQGFSAIKAKLDELVIEAPIRDIELEEEVAVQ